MEGLEETPPFRDSPPMAEAEADRATITALPGAAVGAAVDRLIPAILLVEPLRKEMPEEVALEREEEEVVVVVARLGKTLQAPREETEEGATHWPQPGAFMLA